MPYRTSPHAAPRQQAAPAALLTRALVLAGLVGSLAAMLLLVPVGSAQAAEGFMVAPLRVDAVAKPGQKSTHELTIVNTMTSRTGFTVGVEDIAGSAKDPDAAPILLGGVVDSPISGAGWVTVSDNNFTLDPGQSKRITATVAVPDGATGGHYAALTVSGAGRTVSDALVAQSRVAVIFLINAGNVPPPELVLEETVTIKPGQTIIDYVNPGRKAAKPKIRVVYKDPLTGETVWSSESSDCTTALPGAKGRCRIPDSLKRHHKDAVGPLLVGFAEINNLGKTSRVPMPRQWSGSASSSLLPLAGLGLLFFFFLRIKRRAREDEEDGDGFDGSAPLPSH